MAKYDGEIIKQEYIMKSDSRHELAFAKQLTRQTSLQLSSLTNSVDVLMTKRLCGVT